VGAADDGVRAGIEAAEREARERDEQERRGRAATAAYRQQAKAIRQLLERFLELMTPLGCPGAMTMTLLPAPPPKRQASPATWVRKRAAPRELEAWVVSTSPHPHMRPLALTTDGDLYEAGQQMSPPDRKGRQEAVWVLVRPFEVGAHAGSTPAERGLEAAIPHGLGKVLGENHLAWP
jgi:hypothetical protein